MFRVEAVGEMSRAECSSGANVCLSLLTCQVLEQEEAVRVAREQVLQLQQALKQTQTGIAHQKCLSTSPLLHLPFFFTSFSLSLMPYLCSLKGR